MPLSTTVDSNLKMSNRILDRIAFLKTVALFSDVNESTLAHLSNDFRERSYRKGEIIFHQNDESREFFVVMKGKVRIYHLNEAGEETTVNIFPAKQLLGEFSLVDGLPRSATAETITDCTLLEMSSVRGINHLTNIPGLALEMCRQIADKARWTTKYAETVSRLDAAGRLLHFLLHYNEQFGKEIEPNKQYVVDLGLNQEALGTLIGVDRQWVNKLLRSWKSRNLLEFERGKITILDLPSVEAERDAHMDSN